MLRNLVSIILLALFAACRFENKKQDADTIKVANKSVTLSTDTSKLSQLVDIRTFRPISAKFKYVFVDNSGDARGLTSPGPSDADLQAELHYDTATFRQLKEKYFSTRYSSPGYDVQEFNFDWLDAAVKKELLQSDTNYHGHSGASMGWGQGGKLWLLNNKLLLTKSTN